MRILVSVCVLLTACGPDAGGLEPDEEALADAADPECLSSCIEALDANEPPSRRQRRPRPA
jgi:hypothetical protein